jgi:hypothetical protein
MGSIKPVIRGHGVPGKWRMGMRTISKVGEEGEEGRLDEIEWCRN